MKTLRTKVVMTNLLQWFSLVNLILCSIPALPVGAAELKAELVNKKDEPSGGLSRSTGQVQLIFPDGHTRLLPYRSYLQPLVIGPKVYIFTTKDALLTGIVIYDSAKGRGQSFPLPKDLSAVLISASPVSHLTAPGWLITLVMGKENPNPNLIFS